MAAGKDDLAMTGEQLEMALNDAYDSLAELALREQELAQLIETGVLDPNKPSDNLKIRSEYVDRINKSREVAQQKIALAHDLYKQIMEQLNRAENVQVRETIISAVMGEEQNREFNAEYEARMRSLRSEAYSMPLIQGYDITQNVTIDDAGDKLNITIVNPEVPGSDPILVVVDKTAVQEGKIKVMGYNGIEIDIELDGSYKLIEAVSQGDDILNTLIDMVDAYGQGDAAQELRDLRDNEVAAAIDAYDLYKEVSDAVENGNIVQVSGWILAIRNMADGQIMDAQVAREGNLYVLKDSEGNQLGKFRIRDDGVVDVDVADGVDISQYGIITYQFVVEDFNAKRSLAVSELERILNGKS